MGYAGMKSLTRHSEIPTATSTPARAIGATDTQGQPPSKLLAFCSPGGPFFLARGESIGNHWLFRTERISGTRR